MLKNCIYRLNWGRNCSRSTDIVKTLQYVSKKKPSWFQMISGIEDESEKHVQNLLQILNSTLPPAQEKTAQLQYEVTFDQLKNLLKDGINNIPKLERYQDLNQNELYNKLIMLQLTNKLNANEVLKIFINGKLNTWNKVIDNLVLFKMREKIYISLLVYYKTHRMDIWNRFFDAWLNNYFSLPDSYRRIFWRCVYTHKDNAKDNKLIWAIISKLESACSTKRHFVEWLILYQSLFYDAHKLPLCTHMLDQINAKLFIESLRALSMNNVEPLKNISTKIVKLSIETKLHLQPEEDADKIFEYKFITSLHSLLHDAYVICKAMKEEQQQISTNDNIQEQNSLILKIIQKIDKEIESLQISII